MVIDMGQHVVQDYAQPLTLHQVMVPGLEDRARAFPRLSTARQLSPGALCSCFGMHPLVIYVPYVCHVRACAAVH